MTVGVALLVAVVGLVCPVVRGSEGPGPTPPSRWDLRALGTRITGDVYLPSEWGYVPAARMKNTVWNSNFVAVVMVESADDVREALAFALRHGIQPTVKSSGHDFIGRSAGNGTLSINLLRMRDVSINKTDATSSTGASMTTGPGNSWIRLYKMADKAGMLIVGGSAHTVSPSGYTLGGGHSPLSRTLGLGVDNVLSITMVTANGDILIVTDKGVTQQRRNGTEKTFQDPDLLWALLGGGGGTFGIVTSFTFKLHPPPKAGFVQYTAVYPMVHHLYGNIGEEVLDIWNNFTLTSLTENIGGYVIINNGRHTVNETAGHYINGTITFFLLHYGRWEDAVKTLTPFLLSKREWLVYAKATNYSTFYEYEKSVSDPTGFDVYVINRLLQPKDLEGGSGFSKAVVRMLDYEPLDITCTWVLIGGQVGRPVEGRTSVNPAMRTSVGAMTCGTSWAHGDANSKQFISLMRDYATELYKYGIGTYYNEPDYNLENWKGEYWGDSANYERLLKVKRQWDPCFLFQCHNCVGFGLQAPEDCVKARGVPLIRKLHHPMMKELIALNSRIHGDIYLPGQSEYYKGAEMKNPVWNSNFTAVVMVNNTEDVREVLAFARTHGMQPTVKSTGHDYVGRSAGNGTLSIDLSRMRHIAIDVFDKRSDTGASLATGPGNMWKDLYRAANDAQMLIVGGNTQSVSPSGYTLGGGHSPLSRSLGLAVDNVISITMVTAEGDILTVTDQGVTRKMANGTEETFQDPDLLWALLGGGGGTFGIVTSFTFKLHPPPKAGFVGVIVVFPMIHPLYGYIGEQVVEFWNGVIRTILTDKWGGVVIATNKQLPLGTLTSNGTIIFTLLHFGGWEEAVQTIHPLLAVRREWIIFQGARNYSTFYDYIKDVNDQTGFGIYMFNRVLQRGDLHPSSGLSKAVLSMPPSKTLIVNCAWTLLGGQIGRPVEGRTSVNPAMRTSLVSMTCWTGWRKGNPNHKRYISILRDYATGVYKYGNGTYYNEPDYNLENWKEEYWGDSANYERLLKVKLKYDPCLLFRCHNCVGSNVARPLSCDVGPDTKEKSAARTSHAVLHLAVVTLFVCVIQTLVYSQ